MFAGDVAQLLDAVERFLVSVKDEEVDVDRVLATVLFTDMVGSTEPQHGSAIAPGVNS